jgi:hypothetical protein
MKQEIPVGCHADNPYVLRVPEGHEFTSQLLPLQLLVDSKAELAAAWEAGRRHGLAQGEAERARQQEILGFLRHPERQMPSRCVWWEPGFGWTIGTQDDHEHADTLPHALHKAGHARLAVNLDAIEDGPGWHWAIYDPVTGETISCVRMESALPSKESGVDSVKVLPGQACPHCGATMDGPKKHWLIVSGFTNEPIGCCEDRADGRRENPEATFREVSDDECPVCRELGGCEANDSRG